MGRTVGGQELMAIRYQAPKIGDRKFLYSKSILKLTHPAGHLAVGKYTEMKSD
jgi:hypothetical protein